MIRFIRAKWVWFLGIIAAICFLANTFIFYPGFMSHDTLEQLAQALGDRAYFDWHPPLMALVWNIGISLTGKEAFMLFFQLTTLWISLYISAWLIFKHTESYLGSLIPLIFGFLPFIISISGVIWKDTQMAYALLLATVLVLLFRQITSVKWRILIGAVTALCLIYALSLRYNAILAVIPILYLFASVFTPRKIYLWSIIGFIAILTLVINIGVNSVLKVEKSNPTGSVMLDDVINTKSEKQLADSDIPDEFKTILVEAKKQCQINGTILHVFLFCVQNQSDRHLIQYKYNDDLKRLWTGTLSSQPLGYFSYRIKTFSIFLFTPDEYVYVYHDGIDPNQFEVSVKNPSLVALFKSYVVHFERDFGFIFRPYAWLVLSAVVLLYGVKRARQYKLQIICLSMSAIIYIIGYFPVVIAADYRYIYWSVLATLLAGMLVFLDQIKVKKKK